jgi:hypothetical protein
MNVPYQLGDPLPDAIWQTVKFQTIFECSKWDIQSEDHCVLAEFPLLIAESEGAACDRRNPKSRTACG